MAKTSGGSSAYTSLKRSSSLSSAMPIWRPLKKCKSRCLRWAYILCVYVNIYIYIYIYMCVCGGGVGVLVNMYIIIHIYHIFHELTSFLTFRFCFAIIYLC